MDIREGEKRRGKGYLTYDEVHQILPQDVLSGPGVDEIFDEVESSGIRIVNASEVAHGNFRLFRKSKRKLPMPDLKLLELKV